MDPEGGTEHHRRPHTNRESIDRDNSLGGPAEEPPPPARLPDVGPEEQGGAGGPESTGDGTALDRGGKGGLSAQTRPPTCHGGPSVVPTTCHMNLNPSCQIDLVHKWEEFVHEWRHPAPQPGFFRQEAWSPDTATEAGGSPWDPTRTVTAAMQWREPRPPAVWWQAIGSGWMWDPCAKRCNEEATNVPLFFWAFREKTEL